MVFLHRRFMYLLFQYLHWKFSIFTMMHNGSILGLVHIISELFYMLEIMHSRFLLLLDLHWNFSILVKDELFYILKINVVLLDLAWLWDGFIMTKADFGITWSWEEFGINLGGIWNAFFCDLHEDIFLVNLKEIFLGNFFRNILGNFLGKFLRKCFREIFWEFFWKLF